LNVVNPQLSAPTFLSCYVFKIFITCKKLVNCFQGEIRGADGVRCAEEGVNICELAVQEIENELADAEWRASDIRSSCYEDHNSELAYVEANCK
jgi:hypothetical protein